MHSRYINLLASSARIIICWWPSQKVFLPGQCSGLSISCRYWLFLAVLMFHFQSRRELVWGGLNYSCIQGSRISSLAGSDINCKRKPICKQRETQPLLLLSLSSSILQCEHLHPPVSLELMHKSTPRSVPLPTLMALSQGTLVPLMGSFISIQTWLWESSPVLIPQNKSKGRCTRQWTRWEMHVLGLSQHKSL